MTSRPPINPLRILAVEDDVGSRIALSMVLKHFGHDAVFAGDTGEALDVIANTPAPFDLIITDHVMPGLNGLELVRILREKEFAGEIIVLSGYGGKAVEQEYRNLKVTGFIKKPFNLVDLRQWMDCLPGCRERLTDVKQLPCPLEEIDICWLKED